MLSHCPEVRRQNRQKVALRIVYRARQLDVIDQRDGSHADEGQTRLSKPRVTRHGLLQHVECRAQTRTEPPGLLHCLQVELIGLEVMRRRTSQPANGSCLLLSDVNCLDDDFGRKLVLQRKEVLESAGRNAATRDEILSRRRLAVP